MYISLLEVKKHRSGSQTLDMTLPITYHRLIRPYNYFVEGNITSCTHISVIIVDKLARS